MPTRPPTTSSIGEICEQAFVGSLLRVFAVPLVNYLAEAGSQVWNLTFDVAKAPALVAEVECPDDNPEDRLERARRKWKAGFRRRVQRMERLMAINPQELPPTPPTDGDD